MMHGQGAFYFSLGGLVYGGFINGKAEGLCQLVFPNRDSVTGRWKDGKLHGLCVKYFETCKTWVLCDYNSGELLKTVKRGSGTPSYEVLLSRYAAEDIRELVDRKTAVFDFDEEKPPEEIAHLAFDQASWFHGIMREENPNGIGNMQYNYRKHDRGFFKDGLLQGNGRMIFGSGDVFDGYFHKGTFDGLGIYFRCNESKWLYGLFKQNYCVRTIKTGNGYPFELIRNI